MTFFAWMFVVFAAQCAVNAGLHVFRRVRPGYWVGWTAAGQACVGTGCLASAVMGVPMRESGDPIVWAIGVVGLATFWLGLIIEWRARVEKTRRSPEDARAV